MLRSTAPGLCAIFLLFINYVAGRNARWSEGVRRDVATEEGTVRGYIARDGDYIAFLGVPYAAPPIGLNRYKAPLPPVPRKGIDEANRTVQCPQRGIGDEDCLIANIFTPLHITSPLPVLVYIHGGSFIIGSAPTRGVEPLIKENLIVVTINYRLGALGFLCLGIETAPGNAGLKDQVASLVWVQRNIASFGGDANKVTIYGLSAGAASVDFQVLSKMSKGLFQRAIAESGSATSIWTTDADPIGTMFDLAQALDFPKTDNLHELVEYYKYAPVDKLSQVNYEYYSNFTDGTFGFVACVEKELNDADVFMVEVPYDILTKETYDKVPMMFIFAEMEGLYLRSEEYYGQNYKDKILSNFDAFMPGDLVFDNPDIKRYIAKTIKQFYFGNKTIINDSDDDIMSYLNYFGDYLVLHGLLNSVQIHSRDDNPVYLLEFAYKSHMGSYDKFYDNINAAGHGDVIKHAILIKEIQSEDDKTAVDRVSKLIANFVKFGNPTPHKTQLLPVLWPVVQPTTLNYLQMGKEFQVFENPYQERKDFWDQLYAQFRRKIKPVDPGIL